MTIARRVLLTLSALAFASAAAAAGDPVAGRAKAFTCTGCHGIPGWSNPYPDYRVPKLGGQNAQYIVSALQEYKSGARPFPTMRAQAMSLSAQDMQDIAAFLTQAPHAAEEVH
ncbi:MAG: cytochrome c [Gammaproteobacteria bacterium]|nr:cytochrome c [Gammaproteobacteria bacterium]